MGSIVFGFDEPESVSINGSQVDSFDVIPHLAKVVSIKWPVIQLGDVPIIRKLKRQTVN